MKSLLKVSSLLLFLASLVFLLNSYQEKALGSTLNLAGSTYNLAGNGITSSASSITLQSLTVTQTGALITDAMLSDTFYITLEPGSKTKQEIVSCTTVAQNAGGTATLSGCTRGLLPFTPYTASTTYAFVHAGGSQVIFSDPPQLFNQYLAKANTESVTGQYTYASTSPILYDGEFAVATTSLQLPYANWIKQNFVNRFLAETVAGVKTFSSKPIFSAGGTSSVEPTAATDIATKNYVDNVTNQGAATATESVAGISKLSVAAADANNPIVVGDNDPRLGSPVYTTSTTTSQMVGTTTLLLPSTVTAKENLKVVITVASTTPHDVSLKLNFNNDLATNYRWSYRALEADSGGNAALDTSSTRFIKVSNGSANNLEAMTTITLELNNSTSTFKQGIFQSIKQATSTGAMLRMEMGGFLWHNTTAQINRLDLAFDGDPATYKLGASTTIRVMGY